MRLSASLSSLVGIVVSGAFAGCGAGGAEVSAAPPASLAVTMSYDPVPLGGAAKASVQGLDSRGNLVEVNNATWSVSDPAVLSVTNAGIVTALAVGTARVIVAAPPLSASVQVTVLGVLAADVLMSPVTAVIAPGDSLPLIAVAVDAAGRNLRDRVIKWLSSDTTIVVVSTTGVMHGRGSGVTRVSAIADSV